MQFYLLIVCAEFLFLHRLFSICVGRVYPLGEVLGSLIAVLLVDHRS